MTKTDLWTEHRDIYRPKAGRPELVRVPPMKYLMADGRGDPNKSAVFRDSIAALYGLVYTLKFTYKLGPSGRDFRVMPLSGRYNADNPAVFLRGQKSAWRWTLMIPVPSFVTPAALAKAKTELGRKKGESAARDAVRLETLREGSCVQLLHVGPYAKEGPNIEKLHAFMKEQGYTFAGGHHEIYLSDPSRASPRTMKTIIRQPVRRT